MRVKDLAYKIMDRRVIPFLKFDTRVARNRLFMCIFNDHDPFNEHEMGVHMVDGDVSEVAKLMRSFQVEALDQLIVRIGRVNKASDENLIKFLIYHEEHHWLHFLDSGLSSAEYCKTLDVSDYRGTLIQLRKDIMGAEGDEKKRLNEKFIEAYRSNSYELAADEYALEKLAYDHKK